METTLNNLASFLDSRTPLQLILITCTILGGMGLIAVSQHDAFEHGWAPAIDLQQKRIRFFPVK